MRIPHAIIIASIVISGALPSSRPAAGQTIDPAPPMVAEPDHSSLPKAVATPELTRHAAPIAPSSEAIMTDWPGFLGPRQNGHSTETSLRTDFETMPPKLVWEYETGNGYAAPAIAGGRVIVTHRLGHEVHVDCLDAETGRRFWRHSHDCHYRGQYISDNGPRAAPAIAGGRVFVHSVEGWLSCLDLLTGDVIWRRNPTEEFSIGDHFFGVVSSPVVHGNLLIQNIGTPDHLDGGTVVAFDAATGRIVWATGTRWGPSCASPVIADLHGQQRLFVLTGGKTRPPTGGLMVLDPDTGELLLEHPFRSRTFESVNGANPVVTPDGSVYLTSSYNIGTTRLDIAEDGSFTERWRNRRLGVQFSTPLFVDGVLYLVDGTSDRSGAIVSLNMETGDERARTDIVWDEEVVHNGQAKMLPMSIGEGSMLYVQSRALVLGDNGHLLWVTLSPDGATVDARVSLFRANESWTPPALSRGLLYVCQNRPERFGADPKRQRLMCFDMRAMTD